MESCKKFCVMTVGRSGSTALMWALAKPGDVALPSRDVDSADEELLHPREAGRYAEAYARLTGHAVDGENALIDAFFQHHAGAAFAGFKSMPNRHRNLREFVERKDIQFIVLLRLDLPSTVASFMLAQETGEWRREAGEPQKSWRFDKARHGKKVRDNLAYVLGSVQMLSRIPGAIHLNYEALCSPDFRSEKLDAFFGRHIALDNPAPPTSASTYVENWDEFNAFLRQAAQQLGMRAPQGSKPQEPELYSQAAPETPEEPIGLGGEPRLRKGARIVYAWELGNDLGHLMGFLPLAHKLRERGHEVIFIIRDLQHAESVVGKHGFSVLQAPIWQADVKGLPVPPVNYSEIIIRYGYHTKAGLAGMIKAWMGLLAMLRPQLLVVDHSPVSLLAGRIAGIPRVLYGSGFFNPPLVSPMPNMRPWNKLPEERLLKPERHVLKVANSVLADLKRPPLNEVADLFRVDENFLCSFPELDHYPARTGARYWGPRFNVTQGRDTPWPEQPGKRIFAYLKPGYRDYEKVLEALAGLQDASVLVYSPSPPRKLVEKYQSPRLIFSPQPLKLSTLLSQCDLAVCHAGGTVVASLLAGVPLFLLPMHLEQYLMSWRTETLGAGLLVNLEKPAEDYPKMLRRLLEEPGFRDKAREFAARYAGFSQEKQMSDIADRIDQILSAHVVRPLQA